MFARISLQVACGLLGIVTVAACTGGEHAVRQMINPRAVSTPAAPQQRPVTRADVAQCAKTVLSHAVALPGESAVGLLPGTMADGKECWQVTATMNRTSVTSVPFVIKAADSALISKAAG